MSTKYLADNEILTVAMNMETEGYQFYDKASKSVRDKDTREAFIRLRDEEAEHLATFKEMLASLPDSDANDYFGVTADIASYLEALVDTGVFKNKNIEAMRDMDEIEALQMAVQAERDSVLFYSGAVSSSVNPRAKEAMREIIEVEKGHIVALTNRLRVARKLF